MEPLGRGTPSFETRRWPATRAAWSTGSGSRGQSKPRPIFRLEDFEGLGYFGFRV